MKGSLPISELVTMHLHTIEAVTIGSIAAKTINMEGVIGKVYGVFDRTVNVLAKEEELFTLARKDISKSPITILLDIPLNVDMPTFGVKTGSSVTKSGPFIRISQSAMLISLDKATLWQARRQIKTSLVIKDIMRNCDAARDIGRKYGKRGSLSDCLEHLNALVKGVAINVQGFNLYSRSAFPYVTMLVKAILSKNLSGVHISAKRLIGLGPGLTPSCDDTLTGFISSLLLVTETLSGDTYYAREVGQTITSVADGQTTLLSQKLLEHATLGEPPELTHNVIEAIAAGTEEQVRKVTFKLLAVGHSSGADTLLGILLGFHVAMNMT